MIETGRNLVPVYQVTVHGAAVEDEPQGPDEEQAAVDLQKIRAQRVQVEMQVQNIQGRMRRMNLDILGSSGTDLYEEIKGLEAEIADLEEQRAQHIRNANVQEEGQTEDDPDWDNESDGSDNPFGADEEEEPEPETMRKQSGKVKRLFRKIANKTHPDKTNDPEMHRLFMVARDAFNANDLETLQRVWEVVCGQRQKMRSKLLSKLMDDLQEEMDKLTLAKQALRRLTQSDDFVLLSLYEMNPAEVKRRAQEQMFARRMMLRSHLQGLKRALGIEVPNERPMYSSFFWSNGSF